MPWKNVNASIRFDGRVLLRIGCFAACKDRSHIADRCIEGFEELEWRKKKGREETG